MDKKIYMPAARGCARCLMKYLVLLVMTLFTTSCCHRSYLTCRSEYLYPTYLASEQIDTPDPSRTCFFGQQIVVRWKFPKELLQKPVLLFLRVRYGNREIETVSVPIKTYKGWWIYRLVNDDYWGREGILSFQVQLTQEDLLINQWTHCLWAEIIEIGV